MEDSEKNLGQHDAKFVDTVSNMVEMAADAIPHSFHPMVEQYVQPLAYGAWTSAQKRPSDYGMEYEDAFFPSLDEVPLEAWFIPGGFREVTNCQSPDAL